MFRPCAPLAHFARIFGAHAHRFWRTQNLSAHLAHRFRQPANEASGESFSEAIARHWIDEQGGMGILASMGTHRMSTWTAPRRQAVRPCLPKAAPAAQYCIPAMAVEACLGRFLRQSRTATWRIGWRRRVYALSSRHTVEPAGHSPSGDTESAGSPAFGSRGAWHPSRHRGASEAGHRSTLDGRLAGPRLGPLGMAWYPKSGDGWPVGIIRIVIRMPIWLRAEPARNAGPGYLPLAIQTPDAPSGRPTARLLWRARPPHTTPLRMGLRTRK
jgi:hypothetical protein